VETVQSYRERLPASVLAGHLTCVWVQRVEKDSAPYSHRTVPNGSAELVVPVGELPRVVGPQTSATEEVLDGGTTVVGVRFRPGAAPAVLGVPATEVVDLDLSADELWGRAAVALGEAVAAAPTLAAAAAVLERTVYERLAHAPGLDPVVGEAVRRLLPGGGGEVASIASSLFISERQLRRRCEAAIGVSPKTLARMLRFQRFLALAGQTEHPAEQLARLAAEAGYADQSHLTREAARLDGRSPKALLLDSEHNCGCNHDHAASYTQFLRAG
jgi:AraC-like DNA-binding protein